MTRRNILLMVGGCALMIIAWYLLLWSPKGKEMVEAQERTAASEETASQLEMRLARLVAAKKDAPRLTATFETLRAAVPERPLLADFIVEANQVAEEAGVEFMSITPTRPVASATPGAPTEVALSLTVEGGYYQALDYLDRLLQLPRLVVIDSVQVAPKGDAGDELAVLLTGRMFTQEAAAPAPGTAPVAPPAAPAGESVASVPTSTPVVTP